MNISINFVVQVDMQLVVDDVALAVTIFERSSRNHGYWNQKHLHALHKLQGSIVGKAVPCSPKRHECNQCVVKSKCWQKQM